MNKIALFLLLFFWVAIASAQDLKGEVIINAEQTGQSNLSVFKTLQRSLSEFINQTSWTDREYANHERINYSIFINISKFENDSFSGTIQVQSSRPVFGSTMITPIFNFNDEQFNFNYREFEPLTYSQNAYSSNLVSVISFYVYTTKEDCDKFIQSLERARNFFQEMGF